MGIFRRVNDIVSANVNDLVDRFEDPEKMLKQAIREMETSIEQTTAAAAKAIAGEKLLSKELANHVQQVEFWNQRAATAVQSGDDELARQSLRHKSEHAKLVKSVGEQIESARRAGQTLRSQVEGMWAKHGEARRKLTTIAARSRAAQARQRLNTVAAGAGQSCAAFTYFDRMCEKVELAEAEADAFAEIATGSQGLSALVFDRQADEQAIDSELATLKAQFGK